MISFIIIGKNEGEKLLRCFNSIKAFISNTSLECEIIYVDSKSTDGSFEKALIDPDIKAYRLQDRCNPAIARNYGAKVAQGEVLCFFDGDMELLPGKLEKLISEKGDLTNPIITANRIDVFYDLKGKYIGDNQKLKVGLRDKFEISSGGLMILKKEIWNSVGGMDESLPCFEDIDFVFRVYKKHKIKVFKSRLILVKHHTIRYTDSERYRILIDSDYFMFKGKLYRKHILNPLVIIHMLRSDITILVLLFSVVISILTMNIYFLGVYLLISLIKLFFISKSANDVPLYKRYFMDILKDFKIIFGFFKL